MAARQGALARQHTATLEWQQAICLEKIKRLSGSTQHVGDGGSEQEDNQAVELEEDVGSAAQQMSRMSDEGGLIASSLEIDSNANLEGALDEVITDLEDQQ